MKQLNLKKTLLAICLALPITLTINKATKAMKDLSDDIVTTQEQTSEIFDQYLEKFIKDIPTNQEITKDQTQQLLKTYIGSDIGKYLTVKILVNHDQLFNNRNKQHLRFTNQLKYTYQILQLNTIQPQQRETIDTDHGTAEQIANIKKELIELTKSPKHNTPEEQILKLLLIPNSYEQGSSDFADELTTAVQDYQNATNATIDKKYPTLIQFLEPTEQLLQKTNKYRFPNTEGNPIEIIANNVRAFITTYKQRAAATKHHTEHIYATSEQQSSQTITPLQAEQYQLINSVNQLTQQQTKDIEDKYKTYLILRIQQTLSKLHVERIKKLTSLKNKLEQRQQHQEKTTKHSLQVTQQLLDLFEQLNQSGLLGSISDDLKNTIEAIAKATQQFKETRQKDKQTIDQHDEQIKTLSQLYDELRNKLKQIKQQQQTEGPEQASQIKQ